MLQDLYIVNYVALKYLVINLDSWVEQSFHNTSVLRGTLMFKRRKKNVLNGRGWSWKATQVILLKEMEAVSFQGMRPETGQKALPCSSSAWPASESPEKKVM